ncbi:hypothetical protein DWF74_10515 [Pseudomonas protegens]|nr:hypothetical protein DWF74_10515 [Pseudomonas protegens]
MGARYGGVSAEAGKVAQGALVQGRGVGQRRRKAGGRHGKVTCCVVMDEHLPVHNNYRAMRFVLKNIL